MSRSTANWLFYISLLLIYILFVHPRFICNSELVDETIDTLGFLLSLVGVAIRMIARDWKLEYGSEGVVTKGPYAVVRNPMYVGSLIVGLGLCAIIGSLKFFLLYLLLFFVIHGSVVRSEERFLSKRWPAEFSAYQAAVPAWFPSLARIAKGWHDGCFRFINPRRAIGKEFDSITMTVVAASLLEAHEDKLVEGWQAAHTEVVVFVTVALIVMSLRIVLLVRESHRQFAR